MSRALGEEVTWDDQKVTSVDWRLVAAAIGNAIFDATGARIREVPFTPARVKAAIDSRARLNSGASR
jgi:hypothetical protein